MASRSSKPSIAGLGLVLGLILLAPATLPAQSSGAKKSSDPRKAASGDISGHSHEGKARTWDESDLTEDQKRRIQNLENEVMCDCPKEDYSRTLANCPDACADPQKEIIRNMVKQGRDDEEVFEVMLERVNGNHQVLASARTGWGLMGKILPFVVLFVGGGLSLVVIRGWTQAGAAEQQQRASRSTGVTDEELDAVERELVEFD